MRVVGCVLGGYDEEYTTSLILELRRFVDEVVICESGYLSEFAGGKGATVLSGDFRECLVRALRFDPVFVVTVDGSGNSNPEDIPSLLAPLETGESDVVVGSFFRSNWLDCRGIFRAYSRDTVDFLVSYDGDFDHDDVLFIVEEAGLRVVHVPVTYSEMVTGGDNFDSGFVTNVLDMSVFDRPQLIGFPGLISILLGLISLGWLYYSYIKTNAINPSLVFLSAMTLILGMLCILTALILTSSKKKRDKVLESFV